MILHWYNIKNCPEHLLVILIFLKSLVCIYATLLTLLNQKQSTFLFYNDSKFKNPTIDRFLTSFFGFVEMYFLVQVSIAQKLSVNFRIIHKDKWGRDFQLLVGMKMIWIQLKATEIWVPCPRGSLENPGRVSQAQHVLAAYYLLKIKSAGGTCLGKLEAL